MQHGRSREKRKRLLCFNDKTPFSSCADVSKYFLPCVIRPFCGTSQLAKKPLKLIDAPLPIYDWKGILGVVTPILVTTQFGQ